MANNNKNNLRVGIDIGTSKVVCIIAENTSEGINVLGLGIQNSIGLRDGVIVDIAVSYTHLTLPTTPYV